MSQAVIQQRQQRRQFTRIRNFCWTLANPTAHELEFWANLAGDDAQHRIRTRTRYVVYQSEISESGLHHLQGYTEMLNPRALQTIRRVYSGTATANAMARLHIERRVGTQAQAIAYCKKRDTRDDTGPSGEGGDAKKLGADKVATVAAAIKLGDDLAGLSEDYPVSFIKRGASIRGWALQRKGVRNSPPEVIIYYGPTNTGKSSLAVANWPDAYQVPEPEKGGWWWPGYEGQETIIIDDFRGQYCKYTTLLRLLDRYAFTLQEKGSNSNMISKRIVITTNVHPVEWYSGKLYRDKKPLRRRLRDFARLYVFDESSTYEQRNYAEETDFAAEETMRT